MDFDKLAGNKNVARAAMKKLPYDQLLKLAEVVTETIEAKQEEEVQQQAAEEAKQAKLRELQAAMTEAGITEEDLKKISGRKKRGRPPKQPAQ